MENYILENNRDYDIYDKYKKITDEKYNPNGYNLGVNINKEGKKTEICNEITFNIDAKEVVLWNI